MFSRIKLQQPLQGRANFTTLCLYLNTVVDGRVITTPKRRNKKETKGEISVGAAGMEAFIFFPTGATHADDVLYTM